LYRASFIIFTMAETCTVISQSLNRITNGCIWYT